MLNNDFWIKVYVKTDGTKYYAYVLIYVDNILIVFHKPTFYMTQLQDEYYVKKESVGPLKLCLGAETKLVRD